MALITIAGVRAEDAAAPVKLPTVNEEIRRAAAAAPLTMQFHGTTPAQLAAWQKEFSTKLGELIGPHTPPKVWTVKVLSTRTLADHTREELLLEADGTPSLPLYVLRPISTTQTRFPIVLCLHGHGGYGHDAVAGVDDTPELKRAIQSCNYDYGRQLVREGYLAVCPCFTPFGRRLGGKQREGANPCAVEFVRLMYLGRTLLGENLRDAMWALDYVSTRPDARPDRIGCVGLSYGGRMTMVVAALDPRVKVAVISGALNVFQERIAGAGYDCGAQVIPGLLQYGDTPEIGGLIAPRPTIWEAGRKDPLAVPGWLEKASERIGRAYTAAGVPDNFQVHRFDGGHVWNGETAIPLLAKILKEK
ncbi:MAG TPA: alpha/beta hydrolase family protein [Tepidisphaeraceae bacterium]|nr:alpha/beta hydrolase family protein [Tepidisphaeraceae bacterium]